MEISSLLIGKRIAIAGMLTALFTLHNIVFAQVTVIDGFENNTNPAAWVYQSSMPPGQTLNATPNAEPDFVTANKTEGNLSGKFSAIWNLATPQATISNPYEPQSSTLTYYSMRYNINAPSALPNNTFLTTGKISADFYNDTDYPVAVTFLAKEPTAQARVLQRGPLTVVPSKQAFTYDWNLASDTYGFDLGSNTFSSTNLNLVGMSIYTVTAPTAANFSLYVDNIRYTDPSGETAPSRPVMNSVEKGGANGSAVISWRSSTDPIATYEIYKATDINFGNPDNNKLTFPSTPIATVAGTEHSAVVSGLTFGENTYFSVKAVGTNTLKSQASYSLGINLPANGSVPQDLIVVPVTDNTLASNSNYAQAIVYTAQALSSNARSFQSASSSAIESNAATLPLSTPDTVVVWSTMMDGSSASNVSAISSANLSKLDSFVSSQGKVFIHGSKLVESINDNVGTALYLNSIFKTAYKTGGSFLSNISGVGQFSAVPAFSTVASSGNTVSAFSTDLNNELDVLTPAESVAIFTPSGRVTAVANNGHTIISGFAFESVSALSTAQTSQYVRTEFMRAVLKYLVPNHSTIADWQLF